MFFIWIVLIVILITLFYHLYWKRRNLPPGPMPIPFIGNWVSMAFPMPGYECFRKWTKTYGDVFTFWLGSEPYIIVSSYEKMRDTFVKDGDTYSGKKRQQYQQEFRGGDYGIMETNGHFWSIHRRFALHQFRDFGFGKDLMQQKILIEVQEVFKKYDENLDTLQNVPKILDKAVANVINQLIFGYRFSDENGEEFKKLEDLLDYQQKEFTSLKIIVECFLPFLSNWMPSPTVKELIEQYKVAFYEFFNSQIEDHRQKINFDAEASEDYAEAYLKEQRKREADGDFETFSTIQLANCCMDLWLAGLGTTNLTLSWAISYVLNNNNVLEKIHEEMDQVIGCDRLITMSDKSDLPYTNAVINESQRCANIVPINLFHQTTKDTVVNGYRIPSGTGIIAQISTVMLDEAVFPDPYTFNPDRHIESRKLKKFEELIPFSIGKRQCLGEGLARMELFLFLANFFNQYQISCPNGLPSVDKTKELGVTPRKFEAVLRKRYI